MLLAPVYLDKKRDLKTLLNIFSQQGYARIKMSDSVLRIEDFPFDSYNNETLQLVVDRIILKEDEDFYNRLADAIQTAFFEGKGTCTIENLNTNKTVEFSNKFELDGISFLEPNTHLFSFNNPTELVQLVKDTEMSSELMKNWSFKIQDCLFMKMLLFRLNQIRLENTKMI